METFGIFLFGLVVLVLFIILVNSIKIISEYERLVVFTLGRYSGTRGPGFVFVIPGIERAVRVDQRERFLDIPPQTSITKDNAPISVDFLVYYRIVDPKLSVLKIDNVVSASTSIAMTTLRAVIGDIELDNVLSRREEINDVMRVKLDEITDRWGMKITSVEIKEVEPPRQVLEAMNRQMSAERERRAEVIKANGEKEAAVTRAEGAKQAAILRAEGEKQSAILEAEGSREAELLHAEGYASALKAIYDEARQIDDKTMMLQYFEVLQEVGKSASTKFIVPMELTSLMDRLARNITDLDAIRPLRPTNGSDDKK
jgi:regulator of protease activity HflC (stomatin/prohibitin superfamily)